MKETLRPFLFLLKDMLGTFKAAVPLMAITEIEQYLIESIKSLVSGLKS